jgi:cell division septation protein DedD
MPGSIDNESEILLGNKQLLAVFAVVAILLAIAFTGGYMLGKSSAEKKALAVADSASSTTTDAAGPITRRLTPDEPAASKPDAPVVEPPKQEANPAPEPPVALPEKEPRSASDSPKPGQTFVQVAAVARKDADATAEVLRKHGFHARVAPAPAATGMYRVLVGPGKDPADLRNTEDALRKIGYTKCFVQHY